MYKEFKKTKFALVECLDGKMRTFKLYAEGFFNGEQKIIHTLTTHSEESVSADNIKFEIELFKKEIREEKTDSTQSRAHKI